MKNTNKLLYKAQMGGGTEQADTMQRLSASIQQAIKRGQSPQAVYESLLARKMDKNMALQLVSSIVKNMMDNGDLEAEEVDQAEQKDAGVEQERMQEQQLMNDQKDAAAQQQMDTYRQQSMEAGMDTSEADQAEEADMQDTTDLFGFADGGESNVTGQDIYDEQYGEDEDLKPKVPLTLDQMIASTPGTQNATFAGLEEYYMPYQPLLKNNSINNIDFSVPEAKYGGAHKKQFTKNVMNLLKKAEGGPQEDEVTDSNIATQTDDLTGSVKKKQSSFVDAVGNTAKKVKIDEWFGKLQQTGDPLLQQILSPAPQGDPMQEQMQQIQQAVGPEEEMRRGGQKKKKRKYDRLLNRGNRLLGIEEDMPMVGGMLSSYGNVSTNGYNKYDNFIDQKFNTVDIPALQKYFADLAKQQIDLQEQQVLRPEIDIYETGIFGRPKKYKITYPQPNAKPAQVQANDAVAKNNSKILVPDPGYIEKDGTFNPAPANTMYAPMQDASIAPQEVQDYAPTVVPGAQQFDMGGQYGGFVDPSLPNLSRFIYGGNEFPEEAKNVNDPYFTDMGQYQDGGQMFPNQDQDTENPMHHLNMYAQSTDLFNDPMNQTVQAAKRGGATRRQKRRANNMTAFDNLMPANRSIGYSGSYAQQMNLPTEYGTGNVYMGSMDNSSLVGTDVTKRGMLGNPKQWTDYYYINENGVPLTGPLNIPNSSELEEESGISNRAERIVNRADRRSERQVEENPSPEDNYDDLDRSTRRAVNRGEREAARAGIDNEQYQDGGSTEDENFNFYREMEQSMYTPSQFAPMYRRGGYLPKAFEGLENTPVSYSSNPAFQGKREVDFTADTMDTNTNLQPSSFYADQQSFNQEPPAPNFTQPEQINILNENIEEQQAPKSITAPQRTEDIKVAQGKLIGINRQRQDMRTTDPEAFLNKSMAALKTGLGKVNQFKGAADQRNLYEQNFDPMTLYGTKSRIDKGDWEVNQGNKRINQTGQDRGGRSKQYGGPMFKEGGQNITFMSEEQIQEFLAAGGEIEFL